jgi:transposase
MRSSHRRYADWTIDRIRQDAALIGQAAAALCELILERRPHSEQGFRTCLDIIRLAKVLGLRPKEVTLRHCQKRPIQPIIVGNISSERLAKPECEVALLL